MKDRKAYKKGILATQFSIEETYQRKRDLKHRQRRGRKRDGRIKSEGRGELPSLGWEEE